MPELKKVENKKEVEKKEMFDNPDNPGEMITKEELAKKGKEKLNNPDSWREQP